MLLTNICFSAHNLLAPCLRLKVGIRQDCKRKSIKGFHKHLAKTLLKLEKTNKQTYITLMHHIVSAGAR